MNPKTKMKIRTAVLDYQRMFPVEYKQLMGVLEQERLNLENQFAEIKNTHVIKRGLFTISEKLSEMIGLKLTEQERISFKDKDNARWFAKEFPQFSLTKI